MNMEKVKAGPVYIAVEIINVGYNFERLWTRPTEREHITAGEATEVDQSIKSRYQQKAT
jgi:hypothetical protein